MAASETREAGKATVGRDEFCLKFEREGRENSVGDVVCTEARSASELRDNPPVLRPGRYSDAVWVCREGVQEVDDALNGRGRRPKPQPRDAQHSILYKVWKPEDPA